MTKQEQQAHVLDDLAGAPGQHQLTANALRAGAASLRAAQTLNREREAYEVGWSHSRTEDADMPGDEEEGWARYLAERQTLPLPPSGEPEK